jgi:hypothetical protein
VVEVWGGGEVPKIVIGLVKVVTLLFGKME